MPARVALDAHFNSFINNEIASGHFNNASEVVNAGLRLLEQQELHKPNDLQALRAEIAAGRNSGVARPAEAVFARLEAKYRNAAEGQAD